MMLFLPAVASGMPIMDRVYNCEAMVLLSKMPDCSVNCIVTSPPYYGLRSYLADSDPNKKKEIGLEDTPAAYVERLRRLFSEARRVLRDDGVLWLNIGDSYTGGGGYAPNAPSNQNGGSLSSRRAGEGGARTISAIKKVDGLPPKSLLGIPWRVAFALQDDGWILRSDVIWHKPNPMPESVTDRPTKAHEYVFLFSKQPRYWYDADAIRDPQKPESLERLKRGWNGNGERGYPDGPQNHLQRYFGKTDEEINNQKGSNARTVWTIATQPNSLAHFAMMPPELARRCILAGCPRGGIVLDPFMGAGTTAIEARKLGRHYIGSELNPANVTLTNNRLRLGDETTKAIERGDPITLPMFASEEAV